MLRRLLGRRARVRRPPGRPRRQERVTSKKASEARLELFDDTGAITEGEMSAPLRVGYAGIAVQSDGSLILLDECGKAKI